MCTYVIICRKTVPSILHRLRMLSWPSTIQRTHAQLAHTQGQTWSRGSLSSLRQSISGLMTGFSLGGREQRRTRVPVAQHWTRVSEPCSSSWSWPSAVSTSRLRPSNSCERQQPLSHTPFNTPLQWKGSRNALMTLTIAVPMYR